MQHRSRAATGIALLRFTSPARIAAFLVLPILIAPRASRAASIISSDEIWSGDVTLTGDVRIDPGATLTILPGTRVVISAAADDAHSGIDTSRTEIIVAGRLVVPGDAGDTTRFAPGPLPPPPAGWNGRRAAVSFTADDGFATGLGWASTMAAHHLRMTFFIVPEWLDRTNMVTHDDLRALHAAGHEIAAHTQTHPDLTRETPDQLANELASCRDSLDVILADPSYECRTFAYPFGRYDARVLAMVRALGFEAARAVDHLGPYPPVPATLAGMDLFRIPVAVSLDELAGNNEADTRARVRAAAAGWKAAGAWATIMAHAETYPDPNTFAWIVDELAADGDLWIAPFGEVAGFVRTWFSEDADGMRRPAGAGDNAWEGIRVVAGGEATLANCEISGARAPLRVESGSAAVVGSAFHAAGTGCMVGIGGALTLRDCDIRVSSGPALRVEGRAEISGGALADAAGPAIITTGSGVVVATGVALTGSSAGIRAFEESDITVAGCTVTTDSVGLEIGADAGAHFGWSLDTANILWPNTGLAVQLDGLTAVAAPFNSWGSLSCDEIRSRIAGPVNFTPFTTENRHSFYLDCALDSLVRVPEDYATISTALAAAGPHDSISVAPGEYSVASGESFPLSIHGGMRLVARAAPASARVVTALADSGAAAFLVTAADSGALIRGFDLEGAGGIGIRAAGGDAFSITQNRLAGFDQCIRLEGASPRIAGNTFGASTVAAIACLPGSGDGRAANPQIGGSPASANRFSAGGGRLIQNTQDSITVRAAFNFWGATDCANFTPELSANVQFIPFVDSSATCIYAACDGICATSVASGGDTPTPGTADPREALRIRVAPNPTRQAAAIMVLGGSGERLRIYDTAGRLVRELTAAPAAAALTTGSPPGPASEYVWKTDDDTGRPLPAGIYFAVIRDRGRSVTAKLILTR